MKRIPLLACCLLTLSLASCNSEESIEQATQTERAIKEYQVINLSGKSAKAQAQILNNLGREGWEVENVETEVACNHGGNGIDVGTTSIMHILKRPSITPTEGIAAWEYMLWQAGGKTLKAHNNKLNELGLQGWEVVGTITEIGPVRYPIRWDLNKIYTSAIKITLSRTPNAPKQDITQRQIEYKVLQIAAEKSAQVQTNLLNEAGADRWELTSTYTEIGEIGVQRSGWRAGFVGTYAVNYVLKRDYINPIAPAQI